MRASKAVVPAAGLGTRFLPATKAQPKEMLPVVDKPAIHYIAEEVIASGIDDLLIVTGRGKRAIEDHFDRSIELEHLLEGTGNPHLKELQDLLDRLQVFYVRQGRPLGLGHAIACAERHVAQENFAVLLPDDLYLADEPALCQLLRAAEELDAPVVAVREVPAQDVHRYGIIAPTAQSELREGVYRVQDMVEKPEVSEAPSRLGVVGRYVLPPSIFEHLRATPPGAGGEIQLTDALRALCRERPVYAVVVRGERYDIGEPLGLLRAQIAFALARPDLGEGVREMLRSLL
ncbi:MAG: UTP--glucose-1-phosphate uridylyltransferase GalU [Thermaerobacter sp.]|nr:UTP--glucose-1-phosphate uridylyltransferase GalU [Thermaerobacter sp.]